MICKTIKVKLLAIVLVVILTISAIPAFSSPDALSSPIEESYTTSEGFTVGMEASRAIRGMRYIDDETLEKQGVIERLPEKETLMSFLDDGYVVAIGRGWYEDIEDSESVDGAHEILMIGYTLINGKTWFIVHDPSPILIGKTDLMSYEKMVNGRNPQGDEEPDTGIWIDCVVIDTIYSDNTITYYFGD